jgi:hypothetical protein
MVVAFRNVDATPDDEVSTWPYEAIVATLERGLVSDWQPLFSEVRRNPWGPITRSIERFLGYEPIEGVAPLFRRAISRARDEADRRDREEVASRVRSAVTHSALTAGRFADLVGTSASRLSTYMNGKVTPSAAMLVRIERVSGEQQRAGVSAQRGAGDSRRSRS